MTGVQTCALPIYARQFLTQAGVDVDAIAPEVNEKFFSAFVRANKSKAACCQAGC